jgi:hypothetical protein
MVLASCASYKFSADRENPQEQPMRQTPNSDKMNRISRDLIAGIALVPVSQIIFWLAEVVIFQIIGDENFDHLFVFDQVAIFLAIVQFAYLIPIALLFRHKGRWDVVKGIAIGAILTVAMAIIYNPIEPVIGVIILLIGLIVSAIIDRIIWLYFFALSQPERPDSTPNTNNRFNVSRDFVHGFLLALLLHGIFVEIIAIIWIGATAIWPPLPPRDWYTQREDPFNFSVGDIIRLFVSLALWQIGVFQSLYLVPAIRYLRHQSRPEKIRGLLRVALLTILLNGNYFVLAYGISFISIFIPLGISALIIAGVGFDSLKTRS